MDCKCTTAINLFNRRKRSQIHSPFCQYQIYVYSQGKRRHTHTNLSDGFEHTNGNLMPKIEQKSTGYMHTVHCTAHTRKCSEIESRKCAHLNALWTFCIRVCVTNVRVPQCIRVLLCPIGTTLIFNVSE